MKRPLLSICIPTYNRGEHIKKLIPFFYDEIIRLGDNASIELVVSDNASSDDTENNVRDSVAFDKSFFRYIRQQDNIGGYDNYIFLLKEARGEYVWMCGDDDIYHDGIIQKIYPYVASRDYSLIFINHCLKKKADSNEFMQKSMLLGVDTNRQDQDVLIDITRLHGTAIMFMSSTIHKKENVVGFLDSNLKKVFSFPFLLAFYSGSKGKVKLIPEVLIEDIIGQTSWSNKYRQVFHIDIPYMLRQLPNLGYSKDWIVLYRELLNYRQIPSSWSELIQMSLKNPRFLVATILKGRFYIFRNLV